MKIINKNKKAYHEYEVLDELEAGIKLLGAEVKSLRNGNCNLKGSFCKVIKDEMWLFDTHISKYENMASWDRNLEEKRTRKLLMSRRQIDKWTDRLQKEQNLTVVPLSIYFNDNNKIKLKVALCKGKKLYDKREAQKEKDIKMKELRDY